MNILGISAFYHDSAAALVQDGRVVAAAQEERFSRKKHDADFPGRAVDYCLAEAGIEASELDYVAFYEKPLLKFDRLIETYFAFAPRGFRSFRQALPLWLKEKLFAQRTLDQGLRHRVPGPLRLPGTPRIPCRQRILPQSLRGGGHPDRRRRRRVVDGDHREGASESRRDPPRDPVPSFSWTPLLCLHLLHRLQSEQRRVQAHGSGSLRPAPFCLADPREIDRYPAGRFLLDGHALLQLLPGPDHDRPALPRALRRAAAQARIARDRVLHGRGGQHPAGDRGGPPPDGPPCPGGHRVFGICVWRAASR